MSSGQRRLLYVVGTRSSAAAVAPVLAELRERLPQARHAVLHTGPETASDELRTELRLPAPDYFLDVTPGSPVGQTTAAMERVERVIEVERPNLVLLADDSASTLSAALTALKLYIPTARIEAGLRSFDRHLPEEINRVIMDTFADLLFVSCEQAASNLRAEGIGAERVHLVGSTVADTLGQLEPRISAARAARRIGLEERGYLLVVLRESTLAKDAHLHPLLAALGELRSEMPVVLPAPAGTSTEWANRMGRSGVRIVRPLSYVDQLSLQSTAAAVITDTGPAQDETSFMDVPCLTLGERTERVVSVERGINLAVGPAAPTPRQVTETIERVRAQVGPRPALWDGQASSRLAEAIATRLSGSEQAPTLPTDAMLN
jgi:UDP-N-acetylglucosamine 2-epimerase (non-hydrolysing)